MDDFIAVGALCSGEQCCRQGSKSVGELAAHLGDGAHRIVQRSVIVGRGAGFFLPSESTLHARIVASVESRVSFLAQALRLTREEAAAELRTRDERRARYLTRTLLCNPSDPTVYDLVVNSGRLGVESAAQFIGWAVRTKQQFVDLVGPPTAGIDDVSSS